MFPLNKVVKSLKVYNIMVAQISCRAIRKVLKSLLRMSEDNISKEVIYTYYIKLHRDRQGEGSE